MHADLVDAPAATAAAWRPADEDHELDLRNHLCLALYTANNGMVRAYESRMKALGWTYPQLICMFALWEASPRTVGGISQALNLGKSTVTPILQRLHSRGLIERVRDDVDERKVNIHITDKGRAMKEPVRNLRRELGCDLAVTNEYVDDLKAQLEDLRQRLADAEGRHDGAVPRVGDCGG